MPTYEAGQFLLTPASARSHAGSRSRVGHNLDAGLAVDCATAPTSREHHLRGARLAGALLLEAERPAVCLAERCLSALRRDVAAHEDRRDHVGGGVRLPGAG